MLCIAPRRNRLRQTQVAWGSNKPPTYRLVGPSGALTRVPLIAKVIAAEHSIHFKAMPSRQ